MKRCLLFIMILFGKHAPAQPTVSIDLSAEHQTITGFGAFGGIKAYWEPPPFYTDDFINYFLKDMGTTIVRTSIAWDLEPVNDNASPSNLDLSKFNYKAGSELAKQLPYYKALKDAGLKKLIATSWTPPVWMKLFDDPNRIPEDCYNCNNCPVGDPARKVCGGRINPAYYLEFAEYLVAYVKILKQEIDLDLYAINLQNEPYFANPFEAAVVLPNEFADILKIVGQRFRQEGLTTKIFGPEHMAEWSWGVQQNYVTEILTDSGVKPYLDIYAVHSYVDGVAPDYGSAEGWTALHDNISVNHDIPLWMTETSGYAQTMEGAINLAKSMYLALRFGNISAWVYWGISGEPGSEFALMANGEPTPLYYASKQFYKFITPGSVRVDAQSNDDSILPLAFKNPSDGSLSIVLINSGTGEKSVTIDIPVGPASLTLYRTSSTENCAEVGVAGGSVVLPPGSISTLVGYGPSGPSMKEIPNYYLNAGTPGNLEIPLSDIQNGNSPALTFDIHTSNTSIVPAPSLEYTYPSTTGKLVLSPNTAAPGKSMITVKLTNQNAVGPGQFSFNTTEVTFTVEVVDVITALKKSEDEALVVYPNPVDSRSEVLLKWVETGPYSFAVFDGNGQRIKSEWEHNGDTIFIHTNGWKSGVYFVKISTDTKRFTKKIVIP